MEKSTANSVLTNKERFQQLLNGEIPDHPPHFEIVFQLARDFFDMDWHAVNDAVYGSESQRIAALEDFHIELQLRLVDTFDYAAVQPPNSLEGIRKTRKAIGDRALIMPHDWDGVFWMPSGDEMMNFTQMLFYHPEELHAKARQKCAEAIERIRRQFDAGADLILLAYDFGYNQGPFISPDQFQEFVTPYLTEIVGSIHDMGKQAILHSDGNINALLDQIYHTGIDGYQSVDPQGHMDIREVRRRFPDWLLMGNVNSGLLQFTDEAKIRKSVRYCMTHGGMGKRYIFSTSNCIFDGMPRESYEIMLAEYRSLCQDSARGRI